MTNEIKFTVPLVPPSVNHYKMRTRKGVTFVSEEARKFKEAVAVFGRGAKVSTGLYEIQLHIFLGRKQKGDVDNFLKCPIDGLAEAGIIHSDAAVKRIIAEKSRDEQNPRTEITVRAL